MSRHLRIEPEAEDDLHEAYGWYESCRVGLGDEFVLAIEATLAKVVRKPQVFSWVSDSVQRAIVKRFPYGVFFLVEGDAIVVLAIMHAKRRPSIWKRRKPRR
jgi:toxin ParE1/3/4